jgi:DNA (cytosine-5)-methyltransferase 1
MGYQVNQYIMDSWSYGSGQQRSRVFLTIAAPGLQPIIQPWHTHSRAYKDTIGKSLGKLPNGQKFGEREHYATPFPHLTAGCITSDLPDIGNGNVKTCIPFPDHRVSKPPGRKDRALLACIPLNPPGSGYKEAFQLGLIPESLRKPHKESGKAFRRIRRSGLIPTITTGLSIQDSRNGASVHYREHRPITILEARRAQGYLDEEPIIGDLGEQYRIVGNGVDRKVSFGLGMALRQAVQNNTSFAPHVQQPVDEMLVDVEEQDDAGTSGSASSIIHVEVPLHEGAMTSKTTTANFSMQPTSGRNPASSGINDTDASDTLMLDGTSDARDIEHKVDEATAQPAPKPGIVSRIRRTITNRMAGLALHSRASPPSLSIAPALQSKRAREDGSRGERKDYSGDADEIVPRKRAKTMDVPPISEFMYDTIVVEGRATDTDQVVSRMRHTRHSGLEPSFAPKQWNVRPEKEHAKRNRKT